MLRLQLALLLLALWCGAGTPGHSSPAADCPRCPAALSPSSEQWERPTNELSPSSTATLVPPLLQRIFIAVTFAWSTRKVVHLEHMLNIFFAYPTNVSITIISDNPPNVRTMLQGLGIRGIKIWDKFNASYYGHHMYGLLYEHRFVIGNASLAGGYTTYIYAEDDTRISWPALVSWAWDTQVLEPLGYLRNFIRTEHDANGTLHWLDLILGDELSIRHVVQLVLPPGVPRCTRAARFETAEQCTHEFYWRPYNQFMGMWLASHTFLPKFMASQHWTHDGAQISTLVGFGYPERSTGMIVVVPPLVGGSAAVLIPFFPTAGPGNTPVVALSAIIGHSRNGYVSDPNCPIGQLAIVNAVYNGTLPVKVNRLVVGGKKVGKDGWWKALQRRWTPA